MWFLRDPKPKNVICFFCNIEVDTKQAFVLEYKALDGNGKVNACPMCAGMLNDMMIKGQQLYETD